MNEAILRFSELQKRVGLSRSTIWRLEKAGQFPARRSIAGGLVGWLESEISLWISDRATAASAAAQKREAV